MGVVSKAGHTGQGRCPGKQAHLKLTCAVLRGSPQVVTFWWTGTWILTKVSSKETAGELVLVAGRGGGGRKPAGLCWSEPRALPGENAPTAEPLAHVAGGDTAVQIHKPGVEVLVSTPQHHCGWGCQLSLAA